jgi:hypothetical protein
VYERRLPLVWLTTKGSWSGYRTLPQLRAAIRWFPNQLLRPSMVILKRRTAIEFSASGTLEKPPIPWANSVLPSLTVSVALFIFGQQGLGFVCFLGCLTMLGICLYRLRQRAAMRMLPKGPWSLRVTPNRIDAEVNGVVTHLAPDDVEEAELRTLRGTRGRGTLFSILQLRLRPGVMAPYLTRDGWFPVYWKPTFPSTGVPTELVAALHGFAGHRFGSQLARLARTKRVGRG